MVESLKPSEPTPKEEEILPTWDAPGKPPAGDPPAETGTPPIAAEPLSAPPADGPPEQPVPPPVAEVMLEGAPLEEQPLPAEPVATVAVARPPCVVCGAPRHAEQTYCDTCGFLFPPDAVPILAAAVVQTTSGVNSRDRYELGARLGERGRVERFQALDHGSGVGAPVAVVLLRAPLPPAEPIAPAPVQNVFESETDEITVGFENSLIAGQPITGPLDAGPVWPSLAWEKALLETAGHPFLPGIVDSFVEGSHEYLIEELPVGRSLWDAWDDFDATAEQRFGWLRHVAEQAHALHQAGALPESLRPDIVVVTADGRARLTDLADLLPLPMPADAPVRGTLYTAPELISFNGNADARATLYSFGAMLYALHVGRELTDMDFERPGHPRPFIPRFPDIHPAFGRLMMKTFVREPSARFPSDEAGREDGTGFTELIRTLDACARTLDTVRLEIAAWTTTGMVRTGNEDAFALLHACESRQDDIGESVLVLLADGMGGYDAGEIAAALAIKALRKYLVEQQQFATVAGASCFPNDIPRAEGNAPLPLDVEKAKKLIYAALKEANRTVFTSARNGIGKRGMGCTAEVVWVDGRNVVVGHVGDSRTYHLHDGRLYQLTRDQTLVNRLVELGTLTPEEAETHPRRNELQQAIGGQPDVEPGVYQGTMKPGDWVIVCSDGLSNHVKDRELQQMLQSEAISAEMAARRLVNLVNIEGATDNATVVVIRAT